MPRFLRMTLITCSTCSMPVLALFAQGASAARLPAAHGQSRDQERKQLRPRTIPLSGSRKKNLLVAPRRR